MRNLLQTARKPQKAFRPQMDYLEDRTVPALVFFTIDESISVLTLSGSVGGQAIQQQGNGSLATTFGGYLNTDIDTGSGAITYLDSYVYANNSGNWAPNVGGGGGSAPANYGGRVSLLGTANAAVRDAVVGAYTDGALPLTALGDGAYSHPSWQTLYTQSGSADYNHPILGSGRASIANQFAGNQAEDSYVFDFGDTTYYLAAAIGLEIRQSISGIEAVLNISGWIYGYGYAYAGPGTSPGGSGSSFDFVQTLVYTTSATQEATAVDFSTLTGMQLPQGVAPLNQEPQAPVLVEVEAPTQTTHEAAVDALFADLFV